MEWRKPELIKLEVADLLCRVKVKANSNLTSPCDTAEYAEENACSQLEVGDSWGDGGVGGDIDAPCGVLTQCITIGPLFGCDTGFICSTMMPVLR